MVPRRKARGREGKKAQGPQSQCSKLERALDRRPEQKLPIPGQHSWVVDTMKIKVV